MIRVMIGFVALLAGFNAGDVYARQDIDLFKSLTWGSSPNAVRKYYNLVGPTDVGGKVNVYVSPDSHFGDIYGDLILNFQAGKLTRFRMFLGDKDSGDRFRAALRVMSSSSAWSQIFLQAGGVEVPLLVKPVVVQFKTPPQPPPTFREGKSVWIESPISEEALFAFKQKKSYPDLMKLVIVRNPEVRGAIVTLHNGFVSVTFAPARDLIQELDRVGEDRIETVQPQEPENKDLELLRPVAPK